MPILFTNVRIAPSVDVGSGGMPFIAQPPHAGFALIGLQLRVGHWIDQLTPVYAEMLEDGTLGPAIYGQTFGGWGGTSHELRVSPGHVVTGIQTRSGHYLDAVRLLQARWDGSLGASEATWTPWMGGVGGVERLERIAEPYGNSVAIGIAGRAGVFVDNLTLVSAELVRVAGTPVAKASNDQRGRGSKSASSAIA
jgi:hypothetical protein